MTLLNFTVAAPSTCASFAVAAQLLAICDLVIIFSKQLPCDFAAVVSVHESPAAGAVGESIRHASATMLPAASWKPPPRVAEKPPE